MKVEIDADELCELRKERNKKNSFVTVILPGGRKVRFRGGTTIKADTYESFLGCFGGTVAHSKIAKERDWWRYMAAKIADDADQEIIGAVRILDEGLPYSLVLEQKARKRGYRVPE